MFLLKNDFLLYDETIGAVKTNVYKNKYVIYTLNPRNESIQRTFLYETNPDLNYLNLSDFTYVHDDVRGLLFTCSRENRSTSNPDAQPNSSTVWIHGTEPQNMQTERDLVMCFDFAMSGYIDGDKTAKPNGISVVFFRARVQDQVDLTPGAAETEYEMLDAGGLGPAFSYLSDTTTGTDTQPSLSGLDTGHACVILDPVGNVGNTTTIPNSITVLGPAGTFDDFKQTIPLDTSKYNLWSDISNYSDYTDLPLIRCKVTLTDLGSRVVVHLKNLNDENSKFEKVADVDISSTILASRVFFDNKIFKCLELHTSTSTNQPSEDDRILYNGTKYRCIRSHTSKPGETPDVEKFFWEIDDEWPYNTTVWSSGQTYSKNNWEIVQSYAKPGTQPDWISGNVYKADYSIPGRIKAAMTSNTSTANAGLITISQLVVTGAGNNT